MAIESSYHSEDSYQRQTKVISRNLSVDQHNRYNILAKFLYKNGLVENHTPCSILRNHVKELLRHHHNELDDYIDNTDCLSNGDYFHISGPPSSLL